jgi:hypothetical protein
MILVSEFLTALLPVALSEAMHEVSESGGDGGLPATLIIFSVRGI